MSHPSTNMENTRMTRTDRYEIHLEKIEALRNEALDMMTESRAYREYGDMIQESPTRGAIADRAQAALVDVCYRQSSEVREQANKTRAKADKLERDGIGE